MGGRRMLLSAAGLMVLADEAWACPGCSVPDFRCVSGFYVLSGPIFPVLVVLAGLLKRPLLTWAGVRQHGWAFSIQSSAISMLSTGVVGVVILFVGWSFGVVGGLAVAGWVFGSVLISAMIETWWLARKWELRPSRLVVGNVLAAVVIFTLPMWQDQLDFRTHYRNTLLWEYRGAVKVVTIILCTLAVFWTIRYTSRIPMRPQRPPGGSGFEVVLKQ